MRELAIALVLLTTTAIAETTSITDRMSLVEAIETVRTQGIEIAYSSQLVKPWMRVRTMPSESDPLAALNEVLAVYGLELTEGLENRWLIINGTSESRISSEFTDDEEQNTEPEPVILPPLEEVTVVAIRHSLFNSSAVSEQFMTGDEIRQIPHIADDAFRAFHVLPGVAASDFSAPFHLRGGAIGEVKIVMDGLEIFEPYHMRTIFSPLSIIDPGIIGQAQVLSGGFTADFGNHMSGVIDISSEWPDTEPVHELGVSFVSAFARSSGILASGRGSYTVSGRRGYLDLIADKTEDAGENLVPRYNDMFAKATYTLSETVDVAGQVLLASDNVVFTDPDENREINDSGSLDYAWIAIGVDPSDGVNLRNVLFTGRVDSTENGRSDNLPTEQLSRFYSRDIEVNGLESNLDLRVNADQVWKIGARYRKLKADYDYYLDSLRRTELGPFSAPFAVQRNIVTSRLGEEFGAFAAYRFQPSSRLIWEIGLRWDKQTYTDTSEQTQLSPRFNGLFRLGNRTDIRFGWGRYYQPQGIENLQVQDDIDYYFPAERAEHRVVGIRHKFNSGIEMQADLYAKRYGNVRPRFENALDTYEFAPESTFDRVRIEPEGADTRGFEITLRNRKARGLDWWLNYTWSKAEDQIDGVSVARSWDQRNALTANLAWRGERWNLSAIGRYHSGRPRTTLLVSPILDGAGDIIGVDTDLSLRNDSRFDDYTRVDLRLSRTIDLPQSRFQFYLEVFNVFNTTNECCVPGHNLAIGSNVVASPVIDNYLPFFPSFGFVWTFGPGIDGGSV